jgi:hypothetical protein
MKTLYLYIKESQLVLKYLGKTERNVYEYPGSGIYWKRHLKAHNFKSKDIKTTILLETKNKNELKKAGIYYSELYNIVNSKEWANLKPENGDGGGAKKKAEEKLKISNTMKTKKLIWTEDAIKKRNEKLKGRKMPPCKQETKNKLSEMFSGRIRGNRTKESYEKAIQTKKNNGYIHSEDTKLKIKQKLIGKKRPKDVVDKFGKKVLVDGIFYQSMSEAERVLNKSRFLIKKQHKIETL